MNLSSNGHPTSIKNFTFVTFVNPFDKMQELNDSLKIMTSKALLSTSSTKPSLYTNPTTTLKTEITQAKGT